MANEISKTREISIFQTKGAFSIFRRSKTSKKNYDFEGISALRQLLSNEKARILHTIKTESPNSIYDLAKKLKRGFKSVNDDVKLLHRFGFIDLREESTKKRKRLKPVLNADIINIRLRI